MFPKSVAAVILLLSCCRTSVALSSDHAASPTDSPVGHFALTGKNGKKCLMLDIAATFHVQYEKNDNTTGKVSYNLPIDSTVAGTCAGLLGTKADISLGFFTGYQHFGLHLEFERNVVAVHRHFWLSSLIVYYTLDPEVFPDAKYVNQTMPPEISDMHEFETSISKSYLCKTDEKFDLGYPITPPVQLVIDYIRVQPFDVHKEEFSAAEECPQDHPFSTLPAESTTAPVTTPIPGIPVGHFSVKNDQGEVCLLATWGVRVHVEYEKQNGAIGHAQYVLPTDANVVGSCEDTFATASFRFYNGFGLTAIFQSDTKKFDIASVAVTYNESLPHFPDAKNRNKTTTVTAKDLNVFLIDVGKSYLCRSKQSLGINANVTLEIIDWQVQPFAVKNGTFGDATECSQDSPTNATTIGPATTILPTNHTMPSSPTNHTHTIGPPLTNQTTPSPTNHTHTPVPPHTTPMPTPTEPKQGHYELKDSHNKICLLADMGLQFKATYSKKNKHTGQGVFNVPVKASASGTCGDQQSSLILTFYEGTFNVTFDFQKTTKGKGKNQYRVSKITLTYSEVPSVFPGSTTPNKRHTVSNSSLDVFPADQDKSYKCDADVHVMITKDVDLLVRQVHVQPFDVKNGKFSSAEECSQDSHGGKSSYGLEIGLGVGIAVVILVALGVFWYIRRRAAKKYRKMESVLGPDRPE